MLKTFLNKHKDDIYYPYKDIDKLSVLDGFIIFKDKNKTVLVDYFNTEETVKIPEEVNVIGEYAFYNNKYIKKIDLSNVEIIENKAFSCIDNLKEINIPETVSYISNRAFDCLDNLRKVIINNPDIVIEEEVFDHCYKLKYIYFKGNSSQLKNALDIDYYQGVKFVLFK